MARDPNKFADDTDEAIELSGTLLILSSLPATVAGVAELVDAPDSK
jgi:hypothetical protein